MFRSRILATVGGALLVAAVCWTGCGSSGGECQPVAELCNGLDDDCDDLTDEDFPVDASCTAGVGACQAAGVYRCAEDGASATCDAVAGDPTDEACNQLDDDCDGQPDDDLADCCQPASEQACGIDEGVCVAGVQTCSASGAWEACLSGGAPAVLPGDREDTCNGLDDDCDGLTDEAFTVGVFCSAGAGACARPGVTVCSPDESAAVCDAVAGEPSPEACNGIDDDCDGQTDEELSPLLCANQQGVCAGSMMMACAGGSWEECGASQYGPAYELVEASCDGLDNDCDGTTDEDVQTTYFRDADGDSYGDPNSTRQECFVTPGYSANADDCDDASAAVHPGAGETCDNGIDDDCDGLTDAQQPCL